LPFDRAANGAAGGDPVSIHPITGADPMLEHTLDTAVLDEAPAPEPVTAPVPVTPLGYTQLRLLAEYTAALETDVDFVLTPEGTLTLATDLTDDEVLIPAAQGGKFPRMVVELFAEHEGIVSAPLRLHERCADALFWSDAAVQKFLVPYVASCAGGDAAHALTRLRRAWNEFDPELVWVYALAHVVEYRDGARLSLDHAIQVVYAPAPDPEAFEPVMELLMLPLGAFLDRYPPAVDGPRPTGRQGGGTPRAVSYYRGTDPARYQRPDYRTLRAAAEYACSECQGPKYFTFREGETGFHCDPGLPVLGAGDFVIPVFNPSVPARRPRLHQVACRMEGTAPEVVAPAVDALFWSNAAVAQFMYPYYASKCGMQQGPGQLFWLFTLWTGGFPDVWAGNQPVLPPDAAVSYACGGVETGAQVWDAEVVGLVHFPTSEWLPEIDRVEDNVLPSSQLDEVGVLFAHGGRTRTLPAARFMARHRTGA
jgi:hypothetical protein